MCQVAFTLTVLFAFKTSIVAGPKWYLETEV